MATKPQAMNANIEPLGLPGGTLAHRGSGAIANLIAALFEWFGDLGIFCVRLARAAITPPYRVGGIGAPCNEIGSKSLPLVALAGAATGVVMSLQTRAGLVRFGGKSLIPIVLLLSIIKETGPTITGFIVRAAAWVRALAPNWAQ